MPKPFDATLNALIDEHVADWADFPAELVRYNVFARGVTDLPVHSVLVLLRPKANATDLTGRLQWHGADG
ncbi:MAG: hypothetical protein ACRC7O_04725, partial [Fimbriiglobus sp.]